MANYIVNKNAQPDGYHEIHIDDGSCSHFPDKKNRLNLGYHLTYGSAKNEAKRHYNKVDACYYCLRAHHTR